MNRLKHPETIIKPRRTIYTIVIKRIFDIMLSGLAIVFLWWLLLIILILEYIFHGYPAIYKTKRPGKDGKIFELYKFRSMTSERGENGKLLPGDQRITKFGRFLRRVSMDELPELFNIFKGDMSIIGPRPLLIEYLPLYSKRHAMRHSVRPGLACVKIVPSKSTTWTWGEQFENDIYYIENQSFFLDVKMMFLTAYHAIKGAEYRTDGTRIAFNGHNLDDTRSVDELAENEVLYFDSLEY